VVFLRARHAGSSCKIWRVAILLTVRTTWGREYLQETAATWHCPVIRIWDSPKHYRDILATLTLSAFILPCRPASKVSCSYCTSCLETMASASIMQTAAVCLVVFILAARGGEAIMKDQQAAWKVSQPLRAEQIDRSMIDVLVAGGHI
jgi:hypothetical protein